jgi:ubiquinone/menaquinone biosynthesis C-methylase UbiE
VEVVNADLVQYYRRRAEEYDRVYEKPERQVDIAKLKASLPRLVASRRIIEVAAGTGFWTQVLSMTATSILASDINAEPLAVARGRKYGCPVAFELADAYQLGKPDGALDLAFVGFWWSHIPRRDIGRFLDSLHRRLGPGREVVVLDNRYVEGSNHPIVRTDPDGNTYQHRELDDGSRHEVLKNFPSEDELRQTLTGHADSITALRMLDHYWLLSYTPKR